MPLERFPIELATIDGAHSAMREGTLTAAALVQGCLARIEAYDRQGPALRALISIHADAMHQAARLDEEYRRRGGPAGPLHGIPVVVKDNFDTCDLPTTGGSIALAHSQPARDATTVERIRRAGGIVIGKTNLQEFARGGLSESSLGGQTLNPYDLTRTPGGSSGGTGAALAAGMAVLGTGTDTGQSIRSPASACCLVGVRPTRGLVSRAGVMPNSFTQDEAGPLARTVTDAACLLGVMAGYDPRDPVTALGVGRQPASYVAQLDAGALRGARIGIASDLLGAEARHREVNAVVEHVERTMRSCGAEVLRFRIPGLLELAAEVSTEPYEAAAALDRYFAELGSGSPVKSFRELAELRVAVPSTQRSLDAQLASRAGLDDKDYGMRMLNRDRLRVLVASHMAEHWLDAILYPLQKVLPAIVGSAEQPERNGVLSHGTGFPAVTFPGGFSSPTDTAPLGVPVGVELLGLDFTEPRLLSLAYSFEQVFQIYRLPASTPPL
jgi:Asp-tRNA(Asn)/Glu-tRNA(Gln) amidotransferase A subunit family amidase